MYILIKDWVDVGHAINSAAHAGMIAYKKWKNDPAMKEYFKGPIKRVTCKVDEKLFEDGRHTLMPLSWRRETINYSFAGLDGVVSVDLGRRERKLKQRGFLSANSVRGLAKRIEDISSYIDGQGYQLTDQNGTSYANVRMDNFLLLSPIKVANQARCEYEITYTQLSV